MLGLSILENYQLTLKARPCAHSSALRDFWTVAQALSHLEVCGSLASLFGRPSTRSIKPKPQTLKPTPRFRAYLSMESPDFGPALSSSFAGFRHQGTGGNACNPGQLHPAIVQAVKLRASGLRNSASVCVLRCVRINVLGNLQPYILYNTCVVPLQRPYDDSLTQLQYGICRLTWFR